MSKKDKVKDIYISRNIHQVEECLLRKHLCCFPPENEAAQIYVEFLKQHPKYSPHDIRLRIDSREREEDHYGNGGGVENTAVIYIVRDETAKEKADRIQKYEDDLINSYTEEIKDDVYELLGKMNIDMVPMIERQDLLKRVYKSITTGILKEMSGFYPINE